MMFNEKEFIDSLQGMCESELNALWFEISDEQHKAILEEDDHMDEICGRKLDLIDEQLAYLDHEEDMVKAYEEEEANRFAA